jgi:hypothetical protein
MSRERPLIETAETAGALQPLKTLKPGQDMQKNIFERITFTHKDRQTPNLTD